MPGSDAWPLVLQEQSVCLNAQHSLQRFALDNTSSREPSLTSPELSTFCMMSSFLPYSTYHVALSFCLNCYFHH